MYPGRDYASRGEPIAVINRAKTHCTKGHELTPHPTKPRRRCLVCERAAKLRYKARNPERRKADYAKWYAEHGAQYHRDRRARLKVAA